MIMGGSNPNQRFCEDEDVTVYQKCYTDFTPETPLEQQIQGFDLNLCGNFVRVILRNKISL